MNAATEKHIQTRQSLSVSQLIRASQLFKGSVVKAIDQRRTLRASERAVILEIVDAAIQDFLSSAPSSEHIEPSHWVPHELPHKDAEDFQAAAQDLAPSLIQAVDSGAYGEQDGEKFDPASFISPDSASSPSEDLSSILKHALAMLPETIRTRVKYLDASESRGHWNRFDLEKLVSALMILAVDFGDELTPISLQLSTDADAAVLNLTYRGKFMPPADDPELASIKTIAQKHRGTVQMRQTSDHGATTLQVILKALV